jgi:uncharacterized protein YjeT (DUF2065 family)
MDKLTHMHGKMMECCEKHRRYLGLKMLILGILIIWQVYMPIVSNWWAFAGIILVLAGLLKVIMPAAHCSK